MSTPLLRTTGKARIGGKKKSGGDPMAGADGLGDRLWGLDLPCCLRGFLRTYS